MLTALLVLMTALIGAAAFLFRQDILAGNMQEASLSAKLIDQQLESLGEEVEQIATQRELARLLDDPDGNAPDLEALLAGRRQLANEREAKWLGGTAPFHSFTIFDGRGEILFRDPTPSEGYAGNYSDRDHFEGAMRRGDSAGSHVSLIYDSRTDTDAGTRDKFGISKAIRSPSGKRFVFLASIPTAPTAGLSGFRRNAVLIGRRDPTNELREQYPWLIIAHPALGSDREAIGIEELPISEDAIPGGSGFYFDPAASRYKRFAGPWLAGSAWVEDSEFIVIVQTRDQVTNALLTVAVVALAAGFAVLLWRLRSRRRAVAPA